MYVCTCHFEIMKLTEKQSKSKQRHMQSKGMLTADRLQQANTHLLTSGRELNGERANAFQCYVLLFWLELELQ